MYILLKNTDDVRDKGFYIETKVFDREIEKAFIELYYRGIAEGLVELSTDSKENNDLNVVGIHKWISDKKKKIKREKEKLLIEVIEEKVNNE